MSAVAPSASPESPEVTVGGERPLAAMPTLRQMFRPHLRPLIVGSLWLTACNVLLLLTPRLINEGVALVDKTGSSPFFGAFGVENPSIALVVGSLIGVAIVGAITRTLSRVVLFNVGRDVERDLRSNVFAHLSTLSPTYYRRSSTGDVMSRLTNDMTNIRLMAGFALLNALNALFLLVGTVPILFSIDARTALFSLLPFPLVVGVAQVTTRIMFQRTKDNQEELGKVTAGVQENLAAQQIVRAFSMEDAEIERFGKKSASLYGSAMRLASLRLFLFPIMGLMASLAIAIVLFVGGGAIAAGRMSVGDLVEMSTRLMQLSWPMVAMGFILSVIQRGRASLLRIGEVVRERPDLVDGPHQAALSGHLRAASLTVSPAAGAPPSLLEVSFALSPGQVLGVVGKNASGKSTLVRALVRQLPVSRGQLFFDDVDVNDWHLSALRQGTAVVPEDGFLFSMTLRDNIAFGRPDASDAEIDAVIGLCDLTRDVASFPEGTATLVGERGVTLSGGQRQRVALARALLTRPRILVLDDCLSAVDAKTEDTIVQALRRGFSDGAPPPTVVIISHRLSAVRHADEIVALDAGRIVERGRHEKLLASGGLYADLWGTEQLKKALDAPSGAAAPENAEAAAAAKAGGVDDGRAA